MIEFLEAYDLVLLMLGLAAMGVVVLPRILGGRPLSYPILLIGMGAGAFALPIGLTAPDPIAFGEAAERLTELGVITALMGAGLALNRAPGWKRWASTVRLLAITMPLTIVAVAWLGWWVLGLTPAAAVLLGAVLAPTDPVLASDVQVAAPDSEQEDDEVRFALTSEAGLNDALAFPFTNLAILLAISGVAPSGWLADFLFVEVLYKLTVGLVGGIVVGRVMAWIVFTRRTPLSRIRDGLMALAATLVAYSATELAGGYGFLAVFVAAVVIRNQERKHSYLEVLHQFANQIERMLSAVVLVLFGGALVTGVLGNFDWRAVMVAVLIVFVVRPVTGIAALVNAPMSGTERAVVGFFGIRGVGSFYYLAHAANQVEFLQIEQVWAVTALVVLISVVIHGVTASPAMAFVDRRAR